MAWTQVSKFKITNLFCDFFVFLAAFAGGLALRWQIEYFGGPILRRLDLEDFLILYLFFYGVNALSLSFHAVYPTSRLRSFWTQAAMYARSVGLAFVALILLAYFFQAMKASRMLLFGSTVFAYGLLLLKELWIRKVLTHLRSHGYNLRHAVLVSEDAHEVESAKAKIAENDLLGIEITGVVTFQKGSQEKIAGLSVIGSAADLAKLLERRVVDVVIFLAHEKHPEIVRDAVGECERRGIEIWLRLDILERKFSRASIESLQGLPFINLHSGPQDAGALFVKGVLDRVMAFVFLVLSLPIMLVTAIIIKLETPGPVFIVQYRAGINGRKFLFYKFRSMITNADEYKAALRKRNEHKGPVFKLTVDPRVTKVGKFIRKYSIDELPQLWNVLIGDMSIVGPRPLILPETKNIRGWQRRRLSMKPGLTCIWQASGRSDIADFADWAKMDLQYIDNWSLGLDLKLILKTVPAVLFAKGAR
ncbi:MAG: sugar transferase [Candidatus Omnitrophota bacterium]